MVCISNDPCLLEGDVHFDVEHSVLCLTSTKLSGKLFKPPMFLMSFSTYSASYQEGVLKFPTITVGLAILPFSSSKLCFLYFEDLLAMYWDIYVLLTGYPFHHYAINLFMPNNILLLKFTGLILITTLIVTRAVNPNYIQNSDHKLISDFTTMYL